MKLYDLAPEGATRWALNSFTVRVQNFTGLKYLCIGVLDHYWDLAIWVHIETLSTVLC